MSVSDPIVESIEDQNVIVGYGVTVKATNQNDKGETIVANDEVIWSVGDNEEMPSIVYVGLSAEGHTQYLVEGTSCTLKATSALNEEVTDSVTLEFGPVEETTEE